VIESSIASLITRHGVRVVAAGGFATLSPTAHMNILSYARRNFLVLQPPQEISEGVFAPMYRSTVAPRVGREYSPGQGVFVGLRTRTDVQVIPDEVVSRAVASAAPESDWKY
jgi:hypothetical protein